MGEGKATSDSLYETPYPPQPLPPAGGAIVWGEGMAPTQTSRNTGRRRSMFARTASRWFAPCISATCSALSIASISSGADPIAPNNRLALLTASGLRSLP